MEKPLNMDSIIAVPTSLNGKFFRYWFEFLRPIHKLKDREMDVMSLLLLERFRLAEVIKDEELLDRNLFSKETKHIIAEKCNMNLKCLDTTLTQLRKAKMILNNRINPKFIPAITKEQNNFKLLILFNLNELKRTTL